MTDTNQDAIAEQVREQRKDQRQHVTFFVGGEVFAISMQPLKEIIRLPKIIRVPLSPPALEGIANLRGQVLPIINQCQVFGFPEREANDATRVLIVDCGGMLVGFIVDKVARIINVDPSHIDAAHSIQSTVDSELLQGVIKDVAGYDMMMLLDFNKILNTEFKSLQESKIMLEQQQQVVEKTVQAQALDIVQLVSFEVAGQEYAIDIKQLQEIVQVPEHINHVPKSAGHVLGVVTWRNRLLPLVSLRMMFDLPQQTLTEQNRIVVITLQEGGERLVIGIVTDRVNEVLRIKRSEVEEMPAFLARGQHLEEISAICRLNNGQRLVSIISVPKLFDHHNVRDALKTAQDLQTENASENVERGSMAVKEEQFVIFRLSNEEFGVPINSVKEIVRLPEQLTHVPKAPAFIEGIINLRGAVLPVVDQRLRLGLAHIEHNDRQRIMVFNIAGVRTGFIVDSVSEVLKIPETAIKAAPEVSADAARLIKQVANLEQQQRIILLLNVDELLESHEVHQLSTVSHN